MESNLSIFEKLNAPFEYGEYSVNHDGFVSVTPQATSDRLNQVLGPHGWKQEVLEQIVDMERHFVSILGKISIRDEDGEWIDKCQFGDAVMVIQRNKNEPSAQAINDAKKKAVSDAMKKCASLLGVSSDVYRGRLSVIRANTKEYFELTNKLQLNSNSKQFKEGIVLLPDDYKNYYDSKGWNGIFVSDVNSLGNKNANDPQLDDLKKLYQKGYDGSLDGFQDWVAKMKNKGMTLKNMDYILRETINKRGLGSSNQSNDGVSSTSVTSHTGLHGSPILVNQDQPQNVVLKNIEVVGDEQPYYKLLFEYNGTRTEVFAIAALMDQVDKLTLKEGDTCSILTRQAKGKNILRQIQIAG